mgnify:CR=1 FL=1
MRGCIAFLCVLGSIACTASTALGPAVTCSQVTLSKSAGACDLVTAQCSDSHFYTISCQDDGTCSCSIDNNVTSSFLAADGTTTYCSTMTDTTKFHELGTSCTDAQGITLNLNP